MKGLDFFGSGNFGEWCIGDNFLINYKSYPISYCLEKEPLWLGIPPITTYFAGNRVFFSHCSEKFRAI